MTELQLAFLCFPVAVAAVLAAWGLSSACESRTGLSPLGDAASGGLGVVRGLSGILVAALLLTVAPGSALAAGPSAALREGRALEARGESVKALDRYLGGLDARSRDRRLLRAVQAAAPAGVDALFESSRLAEAELRFGESLGTLDRLVVLRKRLDRRGVQVPRLAELNSARERIAAAGVSHALAEADALAGQGLFAAAIAQLDFALRLQPGRLDAAESLATAWRAWAGEAAAAGRGVVAAERFSAASRVPGAGRPEDARAAAGLWGEAGDEQLEAGRCRSAVGLYELARGLGESLPQRHGEAVDCATVRLALRPATQAERGLLSGNALAALDGQLRVALAAGAGRFVRVGPAVASRTPEARPEAPRDTTGPRPTSAAAVGEPWAASVTVMAVTTRRDPPSVQQRTAHASAPADCRRFPLGAPCVLDVSVTWDEYTEEHRASVVAILRIEAPGGGVALPERRVRVDAASSARWVGGAVSFGVTSDPYGPTAVGVRMGTGAGASRAEIDELRRRVQNELQIDLATALGDEVARQLLLLVDAE